jgi:serine phosphatase RsbU (regulator of sigma subunit)
VDLKENSLADIKFRLLQRFEQFRKNLKLSQLRSQKFIIYAVGWVVSFFALLTSFSDLFPPTIIALALFFYFGFKILDEIRDKINPLPEFLILLFILLFLPEKALLKNILAPLAFDPQNFPMPGAFAGAIHSILLLLLFTVLGALLYQRGKGRFWGIIVLVLFGFFFREIPTDVEVVFWLFQLLLFFLLLRYTTWLEELTRVECWIYFVAILFFWDQFGDLNPFAGIEPKALQDSVIWFTVPYYVFLLFKYYLLALLVKIPMVIIYNHAPLSRKFRIASLFQSSFPQLVQLATLIVIFYFFLSAWQAKNLQDVMLLQKDRLKAGKVLTGIEYFHFRFKDSAPALKIPGYEPLSDWRSLPEGCVLRINSRVKVSSPDLAADYFLFSRYFANDSNHVYLVKIDSVYLKSLFQNLKVLAGNSLLAYPFKPDRWASYIYELKFWEPEPGFSIFPFTVLPYETTSSLAFGFGDKIDITSEEDTINIRIGNVTVTQLITGRVFLPYRAAGASANEYFAVDIALNLQSWQFWKGLGPILLFMMIIYLLLNALVIRRMVKFGSQINQIIARKFKQLQSGIQEVSGGNLDYKIKFEGEDEFVELAAHFNQMGDRLKQTIAEAREKERLQFELQNAREVQLSLLPRQLPDIPGYRVAASLHTATEVGGDFYDVFSLPPGNSGETTRFLVTIGDVSGKGSSAAFYMAQCMSLIRFSRQFTADPAEICTRLNEYFSATLTDRQIFVTAIVGILDIATHEFNFVRAGHTHPFFIPRETAQKIRYLETRGLGIGLTHRDKLFEKTLKPLQITLEPGDTLVLYTDGVVEASRPGSEKTAAKERELYDEPRLEALLGKYRGREAEYIRRELELDLQAFYAGHPRVDDHTVVILQRGGRE